LTNPGFEEEFYYWNGINEIHLAEGWVPWWIENAEHTSEHAPPYLRPEYKQARAAEFPQRVRSGSNAQQWFKLQSSFYAGIYQQVSGAVPGQPYRFSLWAQVWSSTEDNPPDVSTAPANPHLQIGIDPAGNIDPFSVDIIWSPEAPMNQVIDGWSQLTVEASAKATMVTVFVRTRPDFANKHNNIYLDDASLESVGQAPEGTAPATASGEVLSQTSTGAPPALPQATTTIPMTVQPVTLQPVDTATAVDLATATEVTGPTEELPVLPTPQPPTHTPQSEEEPAAPLPSPLPLPTDGPMPVETEPLITVEPSPQTAGTVVAEPTSTAPDQAPLPTSSSQATEVAAASASPTAGAVTGAPVAEGKDGPVREDSVRGDAEDSPQDAPPAVNPICMSPLLGIALLVPVLILMRRRGTVSQHN
jgi:hypothetical protein